MPSTLYRPDRRQHTAAVVDFDAARARLRSHGRESQRTLLVRCATMRADEEILRHIGINSESSLDQVKRIIEIVFAVPDGHPAPVRFTFGPTDSGRLDSSTELGSYLTDFGDALYFHWGLWRFELSLLDTYPRDDATPSALCVAGTGDFADTLFDVPSINAQLLGPATIENVLGRVRDDVIDVVSRSRTMDFLPLLQALDLARPVDLPPHVEGTLRSLPREHTQLPRDAFWCTVLALSCLADDETTNDIIETTMSALGWADEAGHPYSAEAATSLCAGSLVRLASVGGYGPGASAVDKLDMYRALLRR